LLIGVVSASLASGITYARRPIHREREPRACALAVEGFTLLPLLRLAVLALCPCR